jgi:hypothetical protein
MAYVTKCVLDTDLKVVNIVTVDDESDWSPGGDFTLGPGTGLYGQTWDPDSHIYRNPTVAPPTKAQLKTYASDKRRLLAGGQTTVDLGSRSIPVWVDYESRGSAMGLVLALNFHPDLTENWKGADGNFYLLTAAEIPAMALGMMGFISACFSEEETILEAIEAGTITTYAEIESSDWPA